MFILVRLALDQNNLTFDIQQLLFSSPGRKITFLSTFGHGFLYHRSPAIYPHGGGPPHLGRCISKFLEVGRSEIFLGGPQNFGRVCCSMGPRKLMFYCFFKWQFSAVLFYGTQFSSKKSVKNSIHFRIFFQKINVLRFKMVSNGKILKNSDEITHKTPHMLFFENFRKFLEIWPPKPPKIHYLLQF